MKKTVCLIAVALMLTLMTGCERITQIDERAIIQLAGVDIEDGRYRVTVQMFAPNGEQIADASNIHVNTVTGEGTSIGEALVGIERAQGRKPFLGHNYVLVLGESMKNADIESVLRVFAGHPDVYPGMNVVMAKTSAYDIVNLKIPMGMISARTVNKILLNGEETAVVKQADLAKSISHLSGREGAVAIPIVEASENGEQTSFEEDDERKPISVIKMGETALFDRNGFVIMLDTDKTKGLNWLTDNIECAYYTVNIDGRDVEVKVTDAKTTVEPELRGRTVVMKTRICAGIRTIDGVDSSSYDKSYYEKVSQKLESIISEQCYDTALTVIKSGADVLDISKRLEVRNPSYISKIRDNSYLSDTVYEISVICKADK